MIKVRHQAPWLVADLPEAMEVLSTAPFGGGWQLAQRLLWREVRNADLPHGFAVEDWFASEMARAPEAGQIGMLTSCDIGKWRLAEAEVEGLRAAALVTLGLSNAEAVGRRLPVPHAEYGTINILVALDCGLSELAQLEAYAIAIEARTAAVMDLGMELATGRATGTGTDCLALAARRGANGYAGLHTAIGEAVGAATRQAVREAGEAWIAWRSAQDAS